MQEGSVRLDQTPRSDDRLLSGLCVDPIHGDGQGWCCLVCHGRIVTARLGRICARAGTVEMSGR